MFPAPTLLGQGIETLKYVLIGPLAGFDSAHQVSILLIYKQQWRAGCPAPHPALCDFAFC